MKYPYMCPACGEVEVVCSMQEITNPYPCPTCNSPSSRIYKPIGIVFRGGDWASKQPKKINPQDDWVSRRQKEKWE